MTHSFVRLLDAELHPTAICYRFALSIAIFSNDACCVLFRNVRVPSTFVGSVQHIVQLEGEILMHLRDNMFPFLQINRLIEFLRLRFYPTKQCNGKERCFMLARRGKFLDSLQLARKR